jgi:hypothetical protein
MLNFNLTTEEFDGLEGKYRTADNFINYFAFRDEIDKAFTMKGIDKDPTFRVAAITN